MICKHNYNIRREQTGFCRSACGTAETLQVAKIYRRESGQTANDSAPYRKDVSYIADMIDISDLLLDETE